MSTKQSHTGIVKRFNNNTGKGGGYGFIAQEDGPDMFVHVYDIVGAGNKELFPGDQVSFEIGQGKDQRPRAVNVRVQLRAAQPQLARSHD